MYFYTKIYSAQFSTHLIVMENFFILRTSVSEVYLKNSVNS